MRKGLGFHNRHSPGLRFSPEVLFAGGVQGAWYDPSDATTLFEDRAGTTPAKTPGAGALAVVGLMLDKSQGLTLGSELIVPEANRDFSSDTGYWTKETGVTISGGAANWSATANSDLYRLNVLTVGKWYRITWTISSYTSGNFRLSVGGTTGVFRTAAGTYTETYYAASNGTFAITGQSSATGSVDNISVRELAGNHAIAANDTTARPELSARVNLLTRTEELNNAAWASSKINISIADNAAIAPDGTLTASVLTATNNTAYIQQNAGNTVAAGIKTTSFWIRRKTGTGAIYYVDAQALVWISVTVSSTWKLVTANSASTALSICGWKLDISGDEIEIWHPDLRFANIGTTIPAYQRVADQYTYDTVGFPRYLRFDGVDDAMSTPGNVNLSGTDKATVFAGVRKLSDAAAGILTELSAIANNNNGTFAVAAPGWSPVASQYGSALRATVALEFANSPASFTAPITNVLTDQFTTTGATRADRNLLRVNSVSQTLTFTDNTTASGNFGTYPLFIGSRNNTSLRLNGHIYSLIVAGSAVSAGNITATEQWVAGKTGITI